MHPVERDMNDRKKHVQCIFKHSHSPAIVPQARCDYFHIKTRLSLVFRRVQLSRGATKNSGRTFE